MSEHLLHKLSCAQGLIRFRFARPDDADEICKLIRALAVYEHLEHESHPDTSALAADLDPEKNPHLESILAINDEDCAIGFALYFSSYSTFLTRWGIYLEDLFVKPEYRGLGVGFSLLSLVASIAKDRGCERLDWAVLEWNTPSIAFYRQIGAVEKSDWRIMRLEGEALERLGATDLAARQR